MLSGVGPADHLRSHDITVVADLPGVGTHLMDHPVVDAVMRETAGESLNYLMRNGVGGSKMKTFSALAQYMTTGKGPLTTNVREVCIKLSSDAQLTAYHCSVQIAEAAAFFRSSDPKLFPTEKYPTHPEDSTSGPECPDLEFFVTPMGYKGHGRTILPVGNTMGLHMVLLRCVSDHLLVSLHIS